MRQNAQASPNDDRGLMTLAETLPWQRDNEYILTGYRLASYSYLISATSIFRLHNETVNIWSHTLGALLFAALFVKFLVLASFHDGRHFADATAVGVYFVGVIVCFVLSTTFHTFSDHSPHIHRFGNELDHLGIVLVMWGTGVSGAHFAFYCHAAIRNTYFILLTVTAIACAVFTLRPRFRQPSYRTMRFLMYFFLGASLFTPLVHGASQVGLLQLDTMMGLKSFLALGVINFSGAAIYALRIPERWCPGRFDLAGQSHNWMHLLVLTGALVRLDGLMVVLRRWQEHGDIDGYCTVLAA
ncbi:Adiponectin receptor protein 1 [Pleurostoma richardsiae]|uniref:Adiponectin receptor protein 1 n=1 Tax=Pleurostoma richardsiae TaxID=41990 RepID=A0AA38RX79_9PEZI|nr:Adiponectin receptor protein 1 [Pleurostoma richardsiae]